MENEGHEKDVRIWINEIVEKDSGLVIIKHNKGEATMNKKWQSQQVDYMKNEVGIGGSVVVDIKKKGEYINIILVDMNSALRSDQQVAGITLPPPITEQPQPQKVSRVTSITAGGTKDNKIIAQCILKEANNIVCANIQAGMEIDKSKYGEWLNESVVELYGAYEHALRLLNNG